MSNVKLCQNFRPNLHLGIELALGLVCGAGPLNDLPHAVAKAAQLDRVPHDGLVRVVQVLEGLDQLLAGNVSRQLGGQVPVKAKLVTLRSDQIELNIRKYSVWHLLG